MLDVPVILRFWTCGLPRICLLRRLTYAEKLDEKDCSAGAVTQAGQW
jgi:hypothetical protein